MGGGLRSLFVSVSQPCGGFDDPSSIASRASIFVFGSRGISTANPYWMDHKNHHRAGTAIDYSWLIWIGIAEDDEAVALEDFIDVGNILGKS